MVIPIKRPFGGPSHYQQNGQGVLAALMANEQTNVSSDYVVVEGLLTSIAISGTFVADVKIEVCHPPVTPSTTLVFFPLVTKTVPDIVALPYPVYAVRVTTANRASGGVTVTVYGELR